MPNWNTISALFLKPKPAPEVPVPEIEEEDLVEPELVEASLDASGSPAIVEGRPFEEIYLTNGVPSSAYSAEKILAFMAGLATMPPNQIQMVVSAMDAADTSWTIKDPITDAEAKIGVLQAEKVRLTSTAQTVEAQGKTESAALDAGLVTTSTSIREQIEALQAQLQSAIMQVSTDKAAVDARTRAAKEAATRESVRLDLEIGQLTRITNILGPLLVGK